MRVNSTFFDVADSYRNFIQKFRRRRLKFISRPEYIDKIQEYLGFDLDFQPEDDISLILSQYISELEYLYLHPDDYYSDDGSFNWSCYVQLFQIIRRLKHLHLFYRIKKDTKNDIK